MAGALSTISIISFIIAGVFLAIAVFLWFFFKIPSVVGDLSGKTAKKSIAKMRANNEKSGNKSYKTGKINSKRGKITSNMSDTVGNNDRKSSSVEEDDNDPQTGLLAENKARLTEESTVLLEETDDATDLLDGETDVISTPPAKVELKLIDEVMLINTDETID